MLKSVSQVVEAANSKLATFLRSREDEEASLGIGKRKPKLLLEQGQRFSVGKARWLAETDFTIPDPFAERPPLEDGTTSFHFSCIPISRKAVPTFKGHPVQGPFSVGQKPALRHAKYIERDGAAEVRQAETHADYLERAGAVEMADWLSGDEASSADELDMLSGELDATEGVPSIFSNISDDPFERQEYWRAVERCEREPHVHELILEPDITPRWWQELETTKVLDPDFKNHALMVAEAYRQWLDTPVPDDQPETSFVAAPFKVSAERAGEIIMQAQKMRGYEVARPPFEFKSGRGGRIQYRFIAALPHELSAKDRAVIAQAFCSHISGLEERRQPDGTVEKVGMMYTAVIHAPDRSNHRRNYHLHVVAHDRPAKFLDEFGCWDFEYEETYTSHRKTRTRKPHRQLKVREVAGSAKDRSNIDTAGLMFIRAMRKKFAEITNTVLEASGINRRYDPRKYADMGIDRQPTEPLGSKAAALERIGVPTFVGTANAIKIWADKEAAIRKQAKRTATQQREDQSQLRDEIEEIAPSLEPTDRVLIEARQTLRERDRLISEVATERAALLMFAHTEAKAKSRAERTQQTCRQYLESIAAGTATKPIKASKSAIEQRLKAAIDHVAAIDRALDPHRRELRLADREATRHESQIDALATSLRNAIRVLRRRAKAARSVPGLAAKESKHPGTKAPSEAPTISSRETRAEPGKDAGDGSLGAIASGNRCPPSSRAESPTTGEEARPSPSELKEPSAPASNREEAAPATEVAPDMDSGGEPLPDRSGCVREPANSATEPGPKFGRLEPEAGLDHDQHGSAVGTEVAAPEIAPKPMERVAEEGPQAGSPPRAGDVARDDGNRPARDNPAARCRAGNEPSHEPLSGGEQEPQSASEKTAPRDKIPDGWSDWRELINRIARERILVEEIEGKGRANTMIYKVPSLSPEEQELLHARRFHAKTVKRLAAISQTQKQEIAKLVRWICSEHGQNPSLLVLEGNRVRLGNVKPSVHTMFGHWARHPDVITALQNETARRIAVAATLAAERPRQAAKPAPAPSPLPAPDRAARLAEAARLYPAPDQVYTREVAEFTRLLRELASEEEIEAAARRIYGMPDAEEDVLRHTPGLASVYGSHSADFDYENLLQMSQRNTKEMGK